jgi:UDP-N-acetylmuramoyl-L-alanyl-D-glutamate--2,6-diaminopimelate ligase
MVNISKSQNLSFILANLCQVDGCDDRKISDITLDSRAVKPGSCFISVADAKEVCKRHVKDGIERGAAAILCSHEVDVSKDMVSIKKIKALRDHLGTISNRFFGNPSDSLKVCATTGTNGKTTVTYLTSMAIELLGGESGYIGTLGAGNIGRLVESKNTSPDVISLHRWLARFRDEGLQFASIEASSHGLHQGRLDGVKLETAAFTNLSRDHLDYHGTMDAYLASKALLFLESEVSQGIINIDDEAGRGLFENMPCHLKTWTCSSSNLNQRLKSERQVQAGNILSTARGSSFMLSYKKITEKVFSPLIGRFNVDNLLIVVTTLLALGYPFKDICRCISKLNKIPGRMEYCGESDTGAKIYVDYAHTPDSLKAALQAIVTMRPAKISVVFGCGGQRDKGKRALMGAIAEQIADQVIVTADNPRTEAQSAITADILQGMNAPEKVLVIEDRRVAISEAIFTAKAGEVVLIAGKGHETIQNDSTGMRCHSDLVFVSEVLGKVAAI